MSYSRCKRCDEFGREPCGCVPFMVYYPPSFGEEKQEYYGHSFEAVAERLAKEINEYDAPVYEEDVFEEPIAITSAEGVTKRFNCIASVSIDYYASEVEED